MHTWSAVIALAACGIVVGAVSSGGGGEELPFVQWAGAESAHESGFVLVRDEAAWRAMWGGHTGKEAAAGGAMNRHAAPEVNFDRCMVVAFFRGPATNEDGEVVREVAEVGGAVRVRFTSDTFQTASFDGSGGAVKTTPFGIWVLPITDQPIVIEEGTMELKDRPLEWREVKRFAAR